MAHLDLPTDQKMHCWHSGPGRYALSLLCCKCRLLMSVEPIRWQRWGENCKDVGRCRVL